MTGEQVLALPMDPEDNDAKAQSVGEYLLALLSSLWEKQWEFDSKRPWGNSGWDLPVHKAMIQAGAIQGSLDEDGYVQSCEDNEADKLIQCAIQALWRNKSEVRTVPCKLYAVYGVTSNGKVDGICVDQHGDSRDYHRMEECLREDGRRPHEVEIELQLPWPDDTVPVIQGEVKRS